jgi:hypothetical protein
MTDEQWEQRDAFDDAIDEARVILEQAGLDLINTAPTTHAASSRRSGTCESRCALTAVNAL